MVRVRKTTDTKTFKAVFDNFTNVTILKLISKGHLDGLEGPISIGKEASIFLARAQKELVVVKIYRMATCDFNRMYDYIKADPRYVTLDKNRRRVVLTWAQREYRNLFLARKAGIRVPTPRAVMNNVLVMEYIGNDTPAPRLKDAYPEKPQEFLDTIIKYMQKLYKAGLVHTDLSQFNILNHNEEPVFIDLSQATTLDNPNSKEYLDRDIKNICTFFRKNGLDIDEEKTKKQIMITIHKA
jgi:RIO kinase 1